MSDKYYVREWVEKSADEEELQVVRVYESQPKKFTYLVFVEK
jgi:hypothetical protein